MEPQLYLVNHFPFPSKIAWNGEGVDGLVSTQLVLLHSRIRTQFAHGRPSKSKVLTMDHVTSFLNHLIQHWQTPVLKLRNRQCGQDLRSKSSRIRSNEIPNRSSLLDEGRLLLWESQHTKKVCVPWPVLYSWTCKKYNTRDYHESQHWSEVIYCFILGEIWLQNSERMP